jgi:hypothetical protein
MLASPSVDRTIRLWDAETGECLRTIDGHEDEVNAVAFAPTGRTLASLIGKRMIGTEAGKEAVLPVLLEGTPESAFPVLLQRRVFADFRKIETYFDTVFDLILSLHRIPPRHVVAEELRNSLRG